jgi:hypothetical protein
MADLFSGTDTAGNLSLWLTTGTAPSTVELTPITGASAQGIFDGVSDPDITGVSNGFDLFKGYDSSGKYGLWVTNGTAAGTEEVTGLTGANTNGIFDGITDPDFTNMINVGGSGEGETLFTGVDTSGLADLWTTSGKLSVMGASTLTGLYPSDMTNFGNEVIFAGFDSSNDRNLWLTNGTGSGTTEITGVTGVGPNGLSPEDITTFFNPSIGDFALFAGSDSSNRVGLWLTTGTAAGTHEFAISGANTNGIFSGIANPDFTQFGNEILFFGSDSNGDLDLWQTNGTSTVEALKSFGGDSSNAADMIVDGNEVIFSEGWNLWAYNGSTFTELAFNIFDDGSLSGIHPDFTLINGFVEFAGMSDGPHTDRVLYETNGTIGSTAQVTPISGANANGLFYGQDNLGSSPSFALMSVNAPNAFSTNGTSDITIGLENSNVAGEWLIQNAAFAGSAATTLPTGSSVVGTGDFTGNGTADLLIQNGSTVDDVVQAGAGAGTNNLTTLPTDWNLIGTGDFNGDGTSDLLIQSGADLADFLIGIDGAEATGVNIGVLPTGWNIIGTGDFNGDGTTDLLLQSGNTLGTWLIGNGTLVGSSTLGSLPSGWNVVGTGDFTGNGTSDLLLEDGSGDLDDWTIKNDQLQASFSIGQLPAGWQVVGTGDYNGDGTSDLLLQSGNNMMIWTMQNGLASHALALPTLPAGWAPIVNPTGLVA